MSFVCSLPLFMIIGGLLTGALCLLLRGPGAYRVLTLLVVLQTAADVLVLRYTLRNGAFT